MNKLLAWAALILAIIGAYYRFVVGVTEPAYTFFAGSSIVGWFAFWKEIHRK